MPLNECFDTPILFIIFNRPDVTNQVFNCIKKKKPKKLYIAADGPRDNIPSDETLCFQTREICTNIDWPCEIHRKYSDQNLGCGKSVSDAISWFFSYEEYGIILEDDCLPSSSFFTFCQTNLKKYENHSQIMHISGSCHVPERLTGDRSYYYSQFEHVWGWATWRRAWKHYDFNLHTYNDKSRLLVKNKNKKSMLDRLKKENTKFTWDYQWYFTITYNNGLCITPQKSLIKNIGFGKSATNTLFKPKWLTNSTPSEIEEIDHPSEIIINKQADIYLHKKIFRHSKIINILKKIYKILVIKFSKSVH